MPGTFRDIFKVSAEMFDIAARMAEEESADPKCDPIVLESLTELAGSCQRLMMTAKIRAQEDRHG
jgi:hypothetical protein